ncbi:MAG: phosphoribosylaminoimidazolesuccinocarboxamide synthase [Candidatus Wallbacteria bacterium]|nr:phosphoribosylaminoimidazolesuccinocarboxamide synthase [Candidatus Wallbacteria bacterium]
MKKGFNEIIKGLTLIKQGKVRDIYEIDSERLLFVTSDRISAFDVVLPVLVPGKGEVLNEISLFWFGLLAGVIKNHYLSGVGSLKLDPETEKKLRKRSMVVARSRVLPVECVVRGYLAGSGWQEYAGSGSICGIEIPSGLRESEKLPDPIFTPTTKAESGHDLPISIPEFEKIVGAGLGKKIRESSLEIYRRASEYALERGIIIADTKLEFGMIGSELVLVDEVLTPDSSRFWPLDGYRPGSSPLSFDKQYLRDYLSANHFQYDGIPEQVVAKTGEKYREILRLMTAES